VPDIALKIPPPPMFTSAELQPFNRWLLEITKILRASGGIDPAAVEGLEATITQVAVNTNDIANLDTTTGNQGADIANLQNDVSNIINVDLPTINGQLTALGARAQVFNGAGVPAGALGLVGDWYANVGGGVGQRIYIKTAPAIWTPFPF
jgi:hypothetical protein